MTDPCMYELEDIVWEEFGDNDDHIVPHAGNENNGYKTETNSSKRPRHELTSTGNNVGSKCASNNVTQRREEARFSSVNEEKEIILEKSRWPLSSRGPVSVSVSVCGDPNRKASHSASDEATISNQCMKTINMDSTASDLYGDPILGDQTASVDNNLSRYQPNTASHTENDLGFFSNNVQDKESNDILYYGWPDLGNFEDVDKMLRSCDSTFGLGIDNDDELGWFSSSQATEGSDTALKSSFNFSASELRVINNETEREVYGNNNAGFLDDTDKMATAVDWTRGLEKLTSDGSNIVIKSSCSDGYGAALNIEGDPQVCSYVSASKNQKPSEGKRKEQPLDNGDSFINFGNLKQSLEFHSSLWAEPQQRQDIASQAGLQESHPLINSSSVHSFNQVSPKAKSSVVKSEDSGLPSISPRESSYTSNHMQATESSPDASFPFTAAMRNKKKEKLNQGRLSHHSKKCNLLSQKADSDSIPAQKQVTNFENEVEGRSKVGNDIGILGELDSPNLQESSCMSSVLDEVSIEASSFQQLQYVLEQLDIRTKLCIRDSLYRLARSAEQRHKCVNSASISKDDKDQSEAPVSDETSKCPGFLDMETDTNPIDRSIAHLLFHRPSDPSATAALDAVSMMSHTMVQTPNSGPAKAEKFVCQEETTSVNMELLNDESKNCES